MKTFLTVLFLFWSLPAFAFPPAIQAVLGVSTTDGVAGHCDDATHDGGGNAILLCEDFDGSTLCATDYTSTCRNTWTVTLQAGDTLDFDNTSAPAPLQGTYSARLTSAGATGSSTRKSYTASNNSYIFARANLDSLGTLTTFRFFLSIMDSTPVDLCAVGVNSSENWALYSTAGGLSSSAVAVSADTEYCIWLEHVKNTSCVVYIAAYSSGCTKPGSPTHTHGSGGPDVQGSIFGVGASNSIDLVFDYFRLNSSAFGNDPQ